jgi:hypothetical protein
VEIQVAEESPFAISNCDYDEAANEAGIKEPSKANIFDYLSVATHIVVTIL